MKRVLLTTAPREALFDTDGVGGHPYDRTDTYMAWTCAVDVEDRLSVTCPPTGLRFLKANVPDVEVLEYPTWKQYLDALRAERWDMVGISFYTWSTPVAKEMARVATEAGVPEVWGGNYGAIGPGLGRYFTRLVRGPGEDALHRYVYGRPLERIRHPAMFGASGFRGVSSPVGYLYSKRGCNVGCTFCSTPVFNPREDPIALRDMEDALDAYKAARVAHVVIYDESFLLQNPLGDAVIGALAARQLPWVCLTRAEMLRGRIAEFTDRYMDGATIGIESFNEKHHADVRKRDDTRQILETIAEMNRHNRRVIGTFMLGFAADTAEDIRRDVERLAQEELFVCSLTLLTPFHGTRLYTDMLEVISEPDLSKYDLYHLVWDHPHVTPAEARDLLAWAQRLVNSPERVGKKIGRDLGAVLTRLRQSREPRQANPPGEGVLR